MLRLFVGLSVPVLLRQRLTTLQGGIEGARWTERENFHITLTFIGNVDEITAEAVDEALQTVKMEPFRLSLKGANLFDKAGDPAVLWTGVSQSEPLHRLKEKIDRALYTARVPFENRKYVPHVTLARLKNVEEIKIAEFIQQNSLFATEEFDVTEFILYRSRQTKHGAVYEEVVEYPLEEKDA